MQKGMRLNSELPPRLVMALKMFLFGVISGFVFFVVLSSVHIVLSVWIWIVYVGVFLILGMFIPKPLSKKGGREKRPEPDTKIVS